MKHILHHSVKMRRFDVTDLDAMSLSDQPLLPVVCGAMAQWIDRHADQWAERMRFQQAGHARSPSRSTCQGFAAWPVSFAQHSILHATLVPRSVVSEGGLGFVHRAAPGFQFEPPALWRTWCAWSYSNCSYVRMATVVHLPLERKCTRCFRGEID